MKHDQDHFSILRTIKRKPKSTQRTLAKDLGFSLGKLNTVLKLTSERVNKNSKL